MKKELHQLRDFKPSAIPVYINFIPLHPAISCWFCGLKLHVCSLLRRLRISHVDEKTGLTWTKGLGSGESSAYDTEAGQNAELGHVANWLNDGQNLAKV